MAFCSGRVRAIFCTAARFALLPSTLVFAQGRFSDKDVEILMTNLRDEAKSFRPIFESEIQRSAIRKTSREKEAKELASRFEKQTGTLLETFRQKKKGDPQLAPVRSTAHEIDGLVRTLNLGPQMQPRWNKIRADISQISSAFGIRSSENDGNPRGITASPEPSVADPNAPTCLKAIGPERSRRLVEECLAVSPATHPPCNAQNSCALIIDEIKRSCSLLDARTAPKFCAEYH